jgi:hypothetical protein
VVDDLTIEQYSSDPGRRPRPEEGRMKAARLAVIVVVIAVAVVALTLQLTLAQSGSVLPVLNCVIYFNDTNTLAAIFGYVSTFPEPVTLPVGPENFFSPGVLFRNQPTEFLPGLHDNLFATSFVVSGSLTQVTWFVGGSTATARNETSLYCSSVGGAPGPPGPPGAQGQQGVQGPPGGYNPANVRRVAAEQNGSAVAACGTNEALVGGGGSCASATVALQSSVPVGNTWSVTCAPASIKATAIAFCATTAAAP